MAPTKSRITATLLPRKTTSLQNVQGNVESSVAPTSTNTTETALARGKRKAETSPLKNDKIKRSALGNLTNNTKKVHLGEEQSSKYNKHALKTKSNVLKLKNENKSGLKPQSNNKPPPQTGIVLRSKIVTRAAAAGKSECNNTKNPICIPLTAIHNQLFASAQAIAKIQQQKEAANEKKLQQHQKQQKTEQQQHKEEAATIIKAKECLEVPSKPTSRRISNEFEKTDESLYMSALEDITSSQDSVRFSGNFRKSLTSSADKKTENNGILNSIDENLVLDDRISSLHNELFQSLPPSDIVDFDKENWNDPFQISHYVMDIFNYLKKREELFQIDDYLQRQTYITKWMRSLLVDWMVEVQETFELNHETLYLAVKLVDLYLCKVIVQKDKLQLLGAASLFIACKYDERTPPLVDDFLYICDGAYQHKELINMEMIVLKTVDYDLGIPISYRFLRRYARCAKVPMPTLTLARYILEFSLMDYATIGLSDSQLASAALFIALKMDDKENKKPPWDKTLEYYTGYILEDFAFIIPILNSGLHRKPKESIKTIRQKYSHKIFFEVANIPLLTTEKLFENTGLIEDNKSIEKLISNL